MRRATTSALACLVLGWTSTTFAQPTDGDPAPPPLAPAPTPAPAPPPAPTPAPPPAGPVPGTPEAPPPPAYGQQPQAGYGQPPPPAGYRGYAPPGYGAPRPHMVPALRIPYEDGDPILPGYVLESTVKKGLIIAGSTTLGTLWIASMIGGAIAVDNDAGSDFWPLFVPAIGPFIAIGTHDRNATSSLLFTINGLGQSAGLAMLIAGLATENKFLRYRGADLELGPTFHVGADGTSTFGLTGAF